MGLVLMNERDLYRVGFLAEMRSGDRTVASGAALLGLTARHTLCLIERYAQSGGRGLWLTWVQRWRFRQLRPRREHFGELVQVDGSEHRWLGPDHSACTLLVFIDDATRRLKQLQSVPSQSTQSYFGALEGHLTWHGCPVAFTQQSPKPFDHGQCPAQPCAHAEHSPA